MNYDEFFDLGTDSDPLAFLEGMTTASAARLLTETDGMDDEALEEIFQALEEENIPIDLSDLPLAGASGEAARRLREEEQLVRGGKLLTGLEENDPLRRSRGAGSGAAGGKRGRGSSGEPLPEPGRGAGAGVHRTGCFADGSHPGG